MGPGFGRPASGVGKGLTVSITFHCYTGWVMQAGYTRVRASLKGNSPFHFPPGTLGCSPRMNDLSFSSFIKGGGKVDQVVGGDVLSVVEKYADGGAKFRDCLFQFLSFGHGEEGTQLADSLFGGNCHRVKHGRKPAQILYRVSRSCLPCPP